MLDEDQIILKLKQRDRDTLRLVYDLHATRLLNHAFKILLDQADAEDVIHDLFLKLEDLATKKKSDRPLMSWLYGLTHRMSLDKIKKVKRRQGLLNWFKPENIEVEYNHEIKDEVERALSELSPEDRSLIWLKEAEGRSYEEISESIGSPVGTLKSKVSRIKTKLKGVNHES